ncbi:MAG: extensin family protein [Alphaproteobacteria bacterium]|nr:extensin family protein [Alphaproteobacteria bacterium]
MSHRAFSIGRALAAGLFGLVPAPAALAGPDATPPSACQARLSPHAVFKPLGELASPARGPAGCGTSDAVLLQRVILQDRTEVAVDPPATLRCEMAEAVAEFVRSGVAPAAAAMGSRLTAIGNHDSYECRGRNRVPGARLSEHGTANALDIRSITLADGRVVMPAEAATPQEFRVAMKAAACERFTTVLGPGSDGYHEDHVHIDRLERHSGYRLCRWDLADEPRYALQAVSKGSEAAPVRALSAAAAFEAPIPLPRPRPFDARGHAVAPATGSR